MITQLKRYIHLIGLKNLTDGKCKTCGEATQIYDMIDCVYCYNKSNPDTYKLNKNGDWTVTWSGKSLRYKND